MAKVTPPSVLRAIAGSPQVLEPTSTVPAAARGRMVSGQFIVAVVFVQVWPPSVLYWSAAPRWYRRPDGPAASR